MSKIDLSQPPYQVPCPICKAFAMAPCKEVAVGTRILPMTVSDGPIRSEPHDVRWAHWGLSPHLRVKVTDDTWVRWDESFQQWAARMKIHCPTARSYGELMFFAALKLDLTTQEYYEKFFPELDLPLTALLHD
jgi:hypothetical protein